ncbi:MAG TPA: hypothetical protein VG247_31470 [Pseudonocardiaceae bacterium]|jgi:hypothetical protein|nr:hypothetical protein [Pseudonocardiaceae bacterium]
MSLKAKNGRIARLAAIASILTAAATLGMSGTANAAYASPPASTTDWFGLDLVNNPGNRHFEVCDDQSTASRIWVAVADDSDNGVRVLIQDAANGNETYGEYVNFNPGGCEGWFIPDVPSGHTLEGGIDTPRTYSTGPVRYN